MPCKISGCLDLLSKHACAQLYIKLTLCVVHLNLPFPGAFTSWSGRCSVRSKNQFCGNFKGS